MTSYSETSQPSTPDTTAAMAQSRTSTEPDATTTETPSVRPGLGRDFEVAPGVTRAIRTRPYERQHGDPIYRPLRIYALDPAVSRFDGADAVINVPYEPLEPGPYGALLEVVDYDEAQDLTYQPVNLEDPRILIQNGRVPSPSDHLFHQQMVYAVGITVYAAFQKALGRHIAWGFDQASAESLPRTRLRLRPHYDLVPNAHYDKSRGEICFGYYQAGNDVTGRNTPRGFVFTCLSHDIVVHEMTHALLDGLRQHFHIPSSPDTLAFHEAFADLIAIFQRFSYEKVVLAAIQSSRGRLYKAGLLTRFAQQFGETTGKYAALRRAIDDRNAKDNPTHTYENQSTSDPHTLGSVLVAAIFDAFLTVYQRKTAIYLRLATNGTGELPPGELSADLQQILAQKASRLASQFMTMCIRAIDYCPPVDLQLGEFLRALITADAELVPDDPWGYREALIDAFWKRKIYPQHVKSLTEDALLWRPTVNPISSIAELTFAKLQFEGDPGRPAGEDELLRQASALGRVVADPANMAEFGLARPDAPELGKDRVDLPRIESIRTTRRVGPDGQIIFDLVAEVTQRRIVLSDDGQSEFPFFGGSTVILGPDGRIRFVISKSVLSSVRRDQQAAYIGGDGKRFWRNRNGIGLVPDAQLFRLLHRQTR